MIRSFLRFCKEKFYLLARNRQVTDISTLVNRVPFMGAIMFCLHVTSAPDKLQTVGTYKLISLKIMSSF